MYLYKIKRRIFVYSGYKLIYCEDCLLFLTTDCEVGWMRLQANSYAPQNLLICKKESAEPACQVEWIKSELTSNNLIDMNACLKLGDLDA